MIASNFIPDSCIDTLYDYQPLIQTGEPLCKIPAKSLGKEVAVVGAGITGIVAAHELLKMGLKPIVYEYFPRMGGRIYTHPFLQVDDEIKPFAELGAMRIPAASHIFIHYAKLLHLQTSHQFPLLGTVKGTIFYKKKRYAWETDKRAPASFSRTEKLWEQVIMPFINGIHQEWQNGNMDAVRRLWQSYIELFKNKTVYQVLVERLPFSDHKYIDYYGFLGVGTGGFRPFFQFSFLEFLRILCNTYFSNLLIVEDGASAFIEGLYQLKVKTAQDKISSLADEKSVTLNTTVLGIDYNLETSNPIVLLRDEIKHKTYQKEVSAVIYTGTASAAQLIGFGAKTRSGVYLFNTKIREAIKDIPMMAASKTYICTKDKFWKRLNIPSAIITDELIKNMYFLDYPSTKRGVVCLSYTWGMDSLKLSAVEPQHRLIIFKRIMEEISSVANKELEPINGEILSIDWANEKFINGAFNIPIPGTDKYREALYYQFKTALSPHDKGVYLAGDSISWTGGWIEGALSTSLNAVYAVAKRLGARNLGKSPLSQPVSLFHY